MKSSSLNDGETILSQKKFEFKDVKQTKYHGNDYTFSYNLDKYGDIGDGYLVLCFDEDVSKPYLVWYQLPKTGWLRLKNTLSGLGYKKTRTEIESDGSLSTVYKNFKLTITFTSGKTIENDGAIAYTISLSLN